MLALIGGVVGFTGGSLLARQIGRSIFSSQISIPPVLFPVILAIAVHLVWDVIAPLVPYTIGGLIALTTLGALYFRRRLPA